MTEKDEKTCFNAETNDFDQRMACEAPVCWSIYTTSKLGKNKKCKTQLLKISQFKRDSGT